MRRSARSTPPTLSCWSSTTSERHLRAKSDSADPGTGEVFVFTGGKAVHGKWTRDDRLKPFTLTADDGSRSC